MCLAGAGAAVGEYREVEAIEQVLNCRRYCANVSYTSLRAGAPVLSESKMSCCVASASNTELNWKLNDSAKFFGFGSRTIVGLLLQSPSVAGAAVTMVSLSSSCLSSGRMRATTRTLILTKG
jgi:hypothetical protein